ncbi:8275_t:CDS:2 [Diversispora eburnea]|uniref:8275_t:CDS:1 n=1 Tax=Diversispora eburnea TaxID=1213867 RepID=A0A9N8V6E9_9GLOM|nr:8275_t:CDS:2 [Diversispora eburnea]
MTFNFFTTLSNDFSKLLDITDFRDVVIQVGEQGNIKTFEAHSIILYGRCNYFRAALSHGWSKKIDNKYQFNLVDLNITNDAFEVILNGIFCQDYYDDLNMLLQLLLATDILLVKELFDFVEELIILNKSTWIKEDFITVLRVLLQISAATKLNLCYLKLTLNNILPLIRFFNMTPEDIDKKVEPYQQILPSKDFLKQIRMYQNINKIRPKTSIILPPHGSSLDSMLINRKMAGLIATWIDKKDLITNNYELYNGINMPYNFKLLYRSKSHGLPPSRFYHKGGATITIMKMKNTGYLFGGYDPIDWSLYRNSSLRIDNDIEYYDSVDIESKKIVQNLQLDLVVEDPAKDPDKLYITLMQKSYEKPILGRCYGFEKMNIEISEMEIFEIIKSNNIYTILSVFRVISFISALTIVLSYIVLPNKREHPAVTVLCFNLSLLVFLGVTFFYIGDHRKVQCANDITQANISNNLLCGIQEISFEFGAVCLVSPQKAEFFFWTPLAVFVVSGFIIHILTFIHIAKSQCMFFEQDFDESTFSTSVTTTSITKKEVVNAIKIQWRALMLALILIFTFMVFWVYKFITLEKLAPLISNEKFPAWIDQWKSCLITANSLSINAQNYCSSISTPHVPSLSLIIIAEFLTAILGISIFIIFGSSINFWNEWRFWFHNNRIGHLFEKQSQTSQISKSDSTWV